MIFSEMTLFEKLSQRISINVERGEGVLQREPGHFTLIITRIIMLSKITIY